MIQKPFRLRSDAPKVTQSRTHGQSQLIMRQLQPLKLKPSLHIPSLRLSCHKIVSWALKELLESIFGHFSGAWRRLDSVRKHFQPSNTRGNIKLQRHTPEKTPSQTPPGQLPLRCRMDTQPTVHSPANKYYPKTPWRLATLRNTTFFIRKYSREESMNFVFRKKYHTYCFKLHRTKHS